MFPFQTVAQSVAQVTLVNRAADNQKVLDVLNESKGYLEKLKDMDPNQEKTNWAYPLYQIYYAIGDEAKANEMQQLLKK